MIRKNTYLYLLLSTALIGCNDDFGQSDISLSDKSITFGTYVGDSRASATDVEVLQSSTDGFGVIAYHTGEDTYESLNKPNYMNNQQVIYNNGAWNYTPLKYWPSSQDEKISFFAYAPYTDVAASLDATESGITALPSSTMAGDPVLKYEFGSDISKHIDLLYASAKDKTNTSGAVNFEFKHALSRIGFKVCGWEDDSCGVDFDNNTTVTINAVSMSTTRHGASLNISNGEWSEALNGDVHAFTLSGTILQNNVIRPCDPAKRINTDDGYIMIVPDNFITDEASKRYCFLVDYTVETIDPNLAGGKLVTRNKVYRYLSPNFEPGKAYNINIHLGMTDNAGVDDSIDEGPDPIDPNPDDPTEPSTGGKNSYVRFSATVSDWELGEEINTIPPLKSLFSATFDTFKISGECRYASEEMPILTLKSLVAEGSRDNALRSELLVTGPYFEIRDKDLNYAYVQSGIPHVIKAVDEYGQDWETTVTPEFGMMEFTLSIPSARTDYSLPFKPDDNCPSPVLAVWDDEDQSEVITSMTYENKFHTYETPGIKKVRVLCSSTDTQNPQIGYFDISNFGGASTKPLYYSFDTPILKTSQPNFNSLFRDCTNLVSICEDLFKNFPDSKEFLYTFYGCSSLRSIPAGLFKYTNNVVRFSDTFVGCESLSTIPENLFANLTKVSCFFYIFNNCTGLTSIPERLFANNVDCQMFTCAFRNCINLTSIPENLFANNRKAMDFTLTFNGCSNLTTIPDNLFKNNTEVKNFVGVFDGCLQISEIPECLFQNTTKAENFDGVFARTKIESIPPSLFSSCREATSFGRAFASCTSLRDVPETLISNCALTTICSLMFCDCTALTQFPSGFFNKNSKLEVVQSLFEGCSSLSEIPASLFKACPEIQNFGYCFSGCAAITSVPEGLFDECQKASYFKNTFAYCTNLREVPSSLFDYNFIMTDPSLNSVEGLFIGCYNITSTVPELWNRPEISKYTNAYEYCTSAANYSSIPDSWK